MNIEKQWKKDSFPIDISKKEVMLILRLMCGDFTDLNEISADKRDKKQVSDTFAINYLYPKLTKLFAYKDEEHETKKIKLNLLTVIWLCDYVDNSYPNKIDSHTAMDLVMKLEPISTLRLRLKMKIEFDIMMN